MHYYAQRHLIQAIPKDAAVKFDQQLDVSIKVDSPTNEPDFHYYEDGYIEFKTPGFYIIKWTTTSMTGFSIEGPWFELKYEKKDRQWQSFSPKTHPIHPETELTADSGNGWIVFEVLKSDLPDDEDEEAIESEEAKRFRVGLFNSSGQTISLSRFDHVKASITIYGVPYWDEVIGNLLILLEEYEQACCAHDLERLIIQREEVRDYQEAQLDYLECLVEVLTITFEDLYLPDTLMVFNQAKGNAIGTAFPGISLYVQRIGYTYTFWLVGSLTAKMPGDSSLPAPHINSPNTRRYFLTAAEFPALAGIGSTAQLAFTGYWFSTDENLGRVLITIDSQGIYYAGSTPKSNSSDVIGTTWSFAQSIVLHQGQLSIDNCCQVNHLNEYEGPFSPEEIEACKEK